MGKKDFFDMGKSGVDLNFNTGKKFDDNFGLNIDLGMNNMGSSGSGRSKKRNSSMMFGIGELTTDIAGMVRDTKREYNTTRKNIRQIKKDLTPGVRVAKQQTKRGLMGLRARLGGKTKFQVAFIQGGVLTQKSFSNKRQAQAFREKVIASGVGDSVSQVIER